MLFALYPNAKPTHATRPRDAEVLGPEVAAMFAPDPFDTAKWPCVFCSQPSAALRAKPTLPMFDSIKALNTLPPGVAGWPVCRACRVATWALPYGAWVTVGSATVLTCDSPAVEREFAQRNVRRAARIQQLGFSSLAANASAETVTLAAVRAHADQACNSATLWTFKNDNQEPWLRVTATRGGLTSFLVRMMANPDCWRGWRALHRALHRRNKDGRVTVSGGVAAAKLLFDREDRPAGRFADSLFGLASQPWGERHEVLSLAYVDLLTAGLPASDRAIVAAGVAFHHRCLTSDDRRSLCEMYPTAADWQDKFGRRCDPLSGRTEIQVTPSRHAALLGWLAAQIGIQPPEIAGRRLWERARDMFAELTGDWSGPVSDDEGLIAVLNGKTFTSFLPAISKDALKKISAEVRSWRLHRHIEMTSADIARWINPKIRGWMTYYGAFCRSELYPLLRRINTYLLSPPASPVSLPGLRIRAALRAADHAPPQMPERNPQRRTSQAGNG